MAFDPATAQAESFDPTTAKPEERRKPVDLGPEGFKQSMREELASRSTPERFLAGVGTFPEGVRLRLKQILSKLTPEEQNRVLANRGIEADPAGMAGSIVGNLAMTGLPAAGAQGALTQVAGRVLPRFLAPTAAAAGVGAGLGATTTPLMEGETTAGAAAQGAIGGVAGDAVARGLGRVAQPIRQSAPVRALLDEGIVPSVGQSLGGLANRIEQKIQNTVPVIGDLIRRGRDRATGELDVAAIRRALPLTERGQITQGGRDSLETAHRIVSQGYDDVLSRMNGIRPDQPFYRSIVTTVNDPDIALTPALRERFIEIVRENVLRRNAPMSGDLAKRVDSRFGQFATRYSGSADGDQRALGAAFRQAQTSFRELMERNSTPADAEILRGLNGNFANLVRVERAAGYVGAEDGRFSASQLHSAVKATDRSKNKRAFAQGNALMQDLSDPAKTVLGNTVPDSGTAGRIAMMAMMGGAGTAAGNEYMGGPGFLTAAALAPLLYSRAGSRYMIGDLIPGQQAAGNALQNLAPWASQLGRAINQ